MSDIIPLNQTQLADVCSLESHHDIIDVDDDLPNMIGHGHDTCNDLGGTQDAQDIVPFYVDDQSSPAPLRPEVKSMKEKQKLKDAKKKAKAYHEGNQIKYIKQEINKKVPRPSASEALQMLVEALRAVKRVTDHQESKAAKKNKSKSNEKSE